MHCATFSHSTFTMISPNKHVLGQPGWVLDQARSSAGSTKMPEATVTTFNKTFGIIMGTRSGTHTHTDSPTSSGTVQNEMQ